MDAPEIPALVTERQRRRAFSRSDFYGLNRKTYLREVVPADVTARRAG
jgi:hypothetical protein